MHAAASVIAAFIILTSSVVFLASDADASDLNSTTYYKNQLDASQKAIYEQFSAQAEVDPSSDGTNYYYEFTVAASSDPLDDAEKAWEALRLDDPYAFVTWRLASDAPNIKTVQSGAAYEVFVYMDEAFKALHTDNLVTKVKSAVEAVSLSGSNVADRAKSVNGVLEGSTYTYSADGVHCIYGILGSDVHKLSASGFSALFKALCDRTVNSITVPCLQVYGTYQGDGKNVPYAWDLVYIDKQVYACDPATSNSKKADAWLCAGTVSTYSGTYFGNVHRAFAFNSTEDLGYSFDAELLCYSGYEWPSDTSIVAILVSYAPWILVGIICVLLAGVLVMMARKGDLR